jgi:hypothetical protein
VSTTNDDSSRLQRLPVPFLPFARLNPSRAFTMPASWLLVLNLFKTITYICSACFVWVFFGLEGGRSVKNIDKRGNGGVWGSPGAAAGARRGELGRVPAFKLETNQAVGGIRTGLNAAWTGAVPP